MNTHPPRFLIPAPATVGERLELPRDEAAHARVLRVRHGDAVALFDGAGHSYMARIDVAARGAIAVEVTAVEPDRAHESALDLTLAVGLLKSDRIEWLIEKATELGVTRIQPFTSTHTLGQPSPARQTRWRQIALAAAKQSGRSVIPAIAAPIDLAAVLRQPVAVRLLLAEQGGQSDLLRLDAGAPASVQLIVGAEGGFTAAELAATRAAGAHLVGLGPRILRAESAAIAALALCQARWGDLHAEHGE